MFLYIAVDDRTIKSTWNWDFEGCNSCPHRFECYTEDSATIKPVKVDEWEADSYLYSRNYKAEFHLPKCIRAGLFKQIADTGYWKSSYPTDFGDGFKLGGVFSDEGEHVTVERAWVKFPSTLYVTGLKRKVRWC